MILEIHRCKKFKCCFDNVEILTFDDGLYSQFKYFDFFKQLNKPMYFFISTNIVHSNNDSQISDIECYDAHDNYFKNGDTRAYMTWEQIEWLSKQPNVFIGGHTHNHPNLEKLKFVEQLKVAKNEIDCMFNEFKKHNIKINSFCFPYNFEFSFYKKLIKLYDKNIRFFGENRVPIETLLKNF